MRFLSYLAEHPGRAVPLDELHREVWSFGPRVRTRAVYFAVRALRERLEVDPKEPSVLVGTEGRGFELRVRPAGCANTNLELFPTCFVGRQPELDEIHRVLESGARLVTLLGPAGTGKTRLVCRYAEAREGDFPGGAWFCELSEARDLDGVQSAMARALALSGAGEASGDAVGAALARLGSALVVLDNFEQLVEHGPETVGRWLLSAPSARFLVTSRERLRLRGETLLEVGPLSPADALLLFEARARAVRPGWEDNPGRVGELVAQLDRLPLAIELAAARVGTLSAADLLARLADRFRLLAGGPRDVSDRQATLRGALDWSWTTLDAPEQAALAQIAVFRGGFALEAAEAVLDLGPGAPWTADVLQALVDKSLVRRTAARGAPRFELLLTIQEYADQKLGAARAAVLARHGDFFARLGSPGALAEVATRGEVGRAALGLELDNLVVACERACLEGRGPVAVATALAAAEVYLQRGPLSAGAALVRRALVVAGERAAELHHALGRVLHQGRSTAEAERAFHAALEAARQAGDRRVEARALGGLATVRHDAGRLDEAEAAYAESVAIARALGDHRLMCLYLRGLAAVEHGRGHLGAARARYEEAWGLARELGDRRGEAFILLSLAALDLDQGRGAAAAPRYEAARQAALEIGDRVLEGRATLGWANAELAVGGAQAVARYEEALALVRATGDRQTEAYVLANLGVAHRAAGALASARQRLMHALAIFRERASLSAQGACLHELAAVDLAERDPDTALARLSEGEPLLRGRGHVSELGKLLCRRAEARLARGARDEARAALAEAEAVLADTRVGAGSELGRLLAEVRAKVVN